MGRWLVVVIVLAALALAVNRFLIKGGDPPPAGRYGASEPAAAIQSAAPSSPAPTHDGATQDAAGPAVGDGQPKAVASESVASVAGAADVVAAAPSAGPANEKARKWSAAVAQGAKMDPIDVTLGSPDLTAGVPGKEKISLAEIEGWLSDANNHVPLKPALPSGLAEGAGAIQGLDKNPMTRAKIELGRQLYFDPRLSADNTISCSTCHDPETGFAAPTQFGVGIRGQQGNRNSPISYNRILSGGQFWDGRADSLEAQAVGPIANPIEMGYTHEACVAALAKIPVYVAQFEAIFADGLNIDNVGRALATFERAIVTAPTPFDHHQKFKAFRNAYAVDLEDLDALKQEDPELYAQYVELKEASEKQPMSESALRGVEIFFSDKGGCTACHVGANFSDELFHNLGVGMAAAEPDLGRFAVTQVEKDRGAFKTPALRNVAFTAPYMHDGSQKTLEEVVEWYAKGGHPNPWLSEKVKKLNLTDQDKADLVAFMKDGLSSNFPKIERGRLPE